MPEDIKPENTPAPPAPAFDMDALAGQVADKLKDAIKQAAPPPPPPPMPVLPQVTDPLKEMLDPYLEPIRRKANIAEESADDAAEFYGNHPELDKDERKAIEDRFKMLKSKGVPFKREDILNHYVGENIDKVVEKRIKKRDDEIARATNASTVVGGGSPDRGNAPILDARSMSTGDLEKALAGQSF